MQIFWLIIEYYMEQMQSKLVANIISVRTVVPTISLTIYEKQYITLLYCTVSQIICLT
jgi:hypothetical protein